jgi:hypothetical protein
MREFKVPLNLAARVQATNRLTLPQIGDTFANCDSLANITTPVIMRPSS